MGNSNNELKVRKINSWNLSQSSSDYQQFVRYMFENIENWDYYKLYLVNVPLKPESKPAFILKVPDNEYFTWSRTVELKANRLSYVIEENYIVLVLETWVAAPDNQKIGLGQGLIIIDDLKNLNKLLFRQFFDPDDPTTELLINSLVGLQGNDVIFFVTDGNMNYLTFSSPDKSEFMRMLQESKKALSALKNKGSFETALSTVIKKLPIKSRYSIITDTFEIIKNDDINSLKKDTVLSNDDWVCGKCKNLNGWNRKVCGKCGKKLEM